MTFQLGQLKFEGQTKSRSWRRTGLFGLDAAFSNINPITGTVTFGIPTRIGIHLYGATKVGKTHVAASLAARLAEGLGGTVLHIPIDTFDDYLADLMAYQGLTKNPLLAYHETDTGALDLSIKILGQNKNIAVTVLDSIMAISSMAELEGDVSDANMGRRAKVVSAWTKKIYNNTRISDNERIFIATNHQFPNLGTPGFSTPGGKTILGFTSYHVKLSPQKKGMVQQIYNHEHLKIWVLEGKVEKSNFSPTDRMFSLAIVGGLGIHTGLTALFDAIRFNYVQEVKNILTLNGLRLGKIQDFIASWTDNDAFTPFYNVLQENEETIAKTFKAKPPKKKVTLNDDEDDENKEELSEEDKKFINQQLEWKMNKKLETQYQEKRNAN